MTWPEPGDFPAALAWLRDKGVVSDEEYDQLSERERARAFKVAGVAQMDLVHGVLLALESAVEHGDDLDDFKDAVEESLQDAWLGTDEDLAWRLETVFRTNLQGAYAAGRFEGATDEDTLNDRPYWRFDAIIDGRETDICHDADGTILPADHEWWKTHYPPLRFNCRSDVASLTQEEAEAAGVTKSPTDREAGKGFGKFPTPENDWEPDLTEYPDDVVNLYELHGSARGPGFALRPNADGAVRSLEEALDLARKEGIDWDDEEIHFAVAPHKLDEDLANYFRRPRDAQRGVTIPLEDLLRVDGRISVLLSPDIMRSDETILWAIKHETHEIPIVLARFAELLGEMDAAELYSMIDASLGTAHLAACDASDEFIRERRRRNEEGDDDG